MVLALRFARAAARPDCRCPRWAACCGAEAFFFGVAPPDFFPFWFAAMWHTPFDPGDSSEAAVGRELENGRDERHSDVDDIVAAGRRVAGEVVVVVVVAARRVAGSFASFGHAASTRTALSCMSSYGPALPEKPL